MIDTPPPFTLEEAKIEGIEVVTVIAVMFGRGDGSRAGSPYRIVTAFYTMDGELIAERDPWLRGEDVPL